MRQPGITRTIAAVQLRAAGHGNVLRRGISFIELMVVLLIAGILLASAAPSFRRSIEQSHADIAAANLRSIWTAERLYWLENQTFCGSLAELEALDLVDPTVVAASDPYTYSVTADDTTFTAEADRAGNSSFIGGFAVTETGAITGSVSDGRGTTIVPGFLD